jgi:hypothetical protein
MRLSRSSLSLRFRVGWLRKYYVSSKACSGILRDANEWFLDGIINDKKFDLIIDDINKAFHIPSFCRADRDLQENWLLIPTWCTVPTTWELMRTRTRSRLWWLICSYKKKQHKPPPSKKKKRGKNLSPRNRKACHSASTALLQSVAEIGTQSTMKSSRKTLHKLSPHIPQKTPKRNRSSSTYEQK